MKLTKSEKQVILTLCEKLEDSAKTRWESGNFDAWFEFANRMKTTIGTVSASLVALIENADEL